MEFDDLFDEPLVKQAVEPRVKLTLDKVVTSTQHRFTVEAKLIMLTTLLK